MVISSFSKVNKSYGKKQILHDLNFSIEEGKIIGLVGPNGSGKTTIMKLLSKLIYPTSGEILYSKSYSSLIETPAFYNELSGFENLKYFAKIKNVGLENVLEIVDKLGISEFIKTKVSKYSLGMKQKLGIAITLLGYPKLVILDEPLNGLDPIATNTLKKYIREIKLKYNSTFLISSHLLKDLEEISDNVIFIKNGYLLNSLEFKKNSRKYQISFLSNEANDVKNYLNNFKINIFENTLIVFEDNLNDILKILLNNNVKIDEVKRYNVKLEDIYLENFKGDNNV